MQSTTDFSPPYAPPANIIAIIRKWRDHSLPDTITKEWLSKIGTSPNLATMNLRALQFLNLIEPSGDTTAVAIRLRTAPSDLYEEVLQEVVRTAYAPIFQVLDPASASRTQIDDAFRHEKPEAQRSRMVACFLGLCREAGITLKEPPQGGRPPRVAGAKIRAGTVAAALKNLAQAPVTPTPTPTVGAAKRAAPLVEKLLDKFPDFDPAWSEELKASWFAGFSKLQEELNK
jgi:hypothetical protein